MNELSLARLLIVRFMALAQLRCMARTQLGDDVLVQGRVACLERKQFQKHERVREQTGVTMGAVVGRRYVKVKSGVPRQRDLPS